MKLRLRTHAPSGKQLAAIVACLITIIACVSCSDSFRRSGPADEVASGTLCLPTTSTCTATTRLDRESLVGANQLDFELTNRGDTNATITVQVRIPSSATVDADADSADAEEAGSASPTTLVEVEEQLEPGESVLRRITQAQLTTRDLLVLAISCQGCEAELTYTLTNAPLECRSDDDCTGPWICLEGSGRCVECESGSDCEAEQTCSLQTNRCEPPTEGGCQMNASDPLPYAPAGLLLVVAWLLACRRRTILRRASFLVLGMGVGAVVMAATPGVLHAADPPRATFGVGVGPRWFTGELAGVTKRGIGLQVDQELRWQHFGAAVQLGTRYHLTTQDPPPLSRELQVYTLAVGPRAFYHVGDLSLMASAEYQHVGLVTNSLVRITGPDLNYGSAGGTLAARYTISVVELGVRTGFYPIFGLDGALFSVDLTVRLSVK